MRITFLGLIALLLLPLTLFAAPAEVPRTGQNTCYDAVGSVTACAGTSQDGALQAGFAWPDPRFTDNGDDTVSDNLTGLIWAQDASTPATGTCAADAKNWQGALDYVACLNTESYLGYNDWILPNILELKSLVAAGASNPALPTGHPFASVQSGYYWSSSTDAGNTGNAWVVAIDSGLVGYSSKSNFISIWPVRVGQSSSTIALAKTGQKTSYATGDDGDLQRGAASPASRFTNNGDGTVTDSLTGLIWLADANCTDTVAEVIKSSGALTWPKALNWSRNLAAGSCGLTDSSAAGDWRLPNFRELASLVDYATSVPALPVGTSFTGVQSSYYWSSSTIVDSTDFAWSVNLNNGFVISNVKTDNYYVWPVRGGLTTLTFDVTPSAGANGSMTPTIHAVPQGQATRFTIIPDSGYAIESVSGCDGSLIGSIYTTGAITGNCTVGASFADATPPGAPSSVAPVEVSDGSIQLIWTNPADSDFDHCIIYRSLSPGVLGNIISDSATGSSYLDGGTGLVGGATYYYTLRAVDAAGNQSDKTNQVSITLSDYEGSGLSCTVIGSLPYSITEQGLYCFDASLSISSVSGKAVEILTNNVTIDFRGYKLGNLGGGAGTDMYGIYALNRKNIVLKNANIRGFQYGVYLAGGTGHQVLNSNLDGNTQYGIYMTGQGKIEGNLIVNTGGRAGSDSSSIYLNTGASLVRNNIIIGFDAPSGYAANGISLAQSGQNLVQNNIITGSIGGNATISGVYINNDVPGSDIISANIITSVEYGISLYSNAHVVLRKNSFAECTNDYSVGAGSSTSDAGANYPTP